MAIDKTLTTFITINTVFFFCAGLHLFIPLFTGASRNRQPTLGSVASNLLLEQCPLTASMINAGIMLVSFCISVPAIFLKRNLTLLQIHAWLIVICALFTLVIGLSIWFSTLQTRANLAPVWNQQTTFVQSMLQFKFKCCGYSDPTMAIRDGTCSNATAVATHGTCNGPFEVFANSFLDIVFTTFFGFVAVDMILLLSVLCVLKERKEQIRYKLIDEKRAFGGI